MAAGTGVRPSEFNPSREKKALFLQIWIKPDQLGAFPRYAGQSFKNADSRKLHLVTSKTGREGSIAINQGADLWLAKLESGDRDDHTLKAGRHAWVQVAGGEITLNGTKFSPAMLRRYRKKRIWNCVPTKNRRCCSLISTECAAKLFL